MTAAQSTATKASAAPERSLAQRLDALEEANRIRTYRANLKRDVKARRVRWVDVLDRQEVQTMKVFDLLLAVPKLGRVKVSKIVTMCRVSPSKTIGGLTQRQRDDLICAAGISYPRTAGVSTTPPLYRRRRDRAVIEAIEERAAEQFRHHAHHRNPEAIR